MVDSLGLYGRYIPVSFRSQMQYRACFIMLSLGHFAMTGLEFIGIWVLFERFQRIEGWALLEVALFYGITNMAFALADATSRGFDSFADYVKNANLIGCCSDRAAACCSWPAVN